jgi:hypothetical protein
VDYWLWESVPAIATVMMIIRIKMITFSAIGTKLTAPELFLRAGLRLHGNTEDITDGFLDILTNWHTFD